MKFPFLTPVKLVSNKLGRTSPAYRRLKKGEFPTFYVDYQWGGEHETVMRVRRKDGSLHSYYYGVFTEDLVPEKIFNKQLEDYL